MDRYEPGTSIRIWDRVKDVSGSLVNADAVYCYIYLDSEAVVTRQQMTTDDTGIYYYDWQTSTEDEEGRYTVLTVAINGTNKSRKRMKDLFEICDQTQ